MSQLKSYTTSHGHELLYTGDPNFDLVEKLAAGPGDLWHSSHEQGFKDCFPEIVYQTAVYWWFVNDFPGLKESVSWRVNKEAFVIRKSVWKALNGFFEGYENELMKGLDLGFDLLRNRGGVPLYVEGLFKDKSNQDSISKKDRYLFFRRFFKKHHSYYMMLRRGVFAWPSEYKAMKWAAKIDLKQRTGYIPLRGLKAIDGAPTVSLVIPTMKRQEYTELLLKDHNEQTYPIKEAVIVDATPEEERDPEKYNPDNFKFDIKLKWQTSKGSCRARNEAIEMCTGDYILFADDDIRIFPDFVENHIRLLQTYNAVAANGLDIAATDLNQDQEDLKAKLEELGDARWKVGVSHMFSNANSFVKRELVNQLDGNDILFDGGYGEDADFGLRILKSGHVLLHNPYSPILHLKPISGGYRFWGKQASLMGKKRKTQPWEYGKPVKYVRPVPSPTVTYGVLKHFKPKQIKEWRFKHFFKYLFQSKKDFFILRLIKLPWKQLAFSRSLFYAKRLLEMNQKSSN